MTQKELAIDILAEAYSNCETKEEAVGVSKVSKVFIKKTDMSAQEKGEYIHRIFSKLIDLGYNEDVFPVNEDEYYKAKFNIT